MKKKGEGRGGLKEREGLNNFLPLKRGGLIRGFTVMSFDPRRLLVVASFLVCLPHFTADR